MVGCTAPPNAACGGLARAIEPTPATCAGTAFITTLDGIDRLAAGNVQPGAGDRLPALDDGGPRADRRQHLGRDLRSGGLPDADDGLVERLAHVGGKPPDGRLDLGRGHADARRTATVELLCLFVEGGTASRERTSSMSSVAT